MCPPPQVLHLAEELHRRIIGQEEAVTAVAEAIQRSQAGMKDPNGPIASFLFLGPTGGLALGRSGCPSCVLCLFSMPTCVCQALEKTHVLAALAGVGKTELAKALAVALFNAEDAMVSADVWLQQLD